MSEREHDNDGPPEVAEAEQPQGRRPVWRPVALAAVVLVSAAAGAVIGHEFWSTSRPATGPAGEGSPIAAAVDSALVDIGLRFTDGSAGAATGIVVSPDGEVLTNNHVIDGASGITATDIGNGRTYAVTVVGYAPSVDIAVLKLQGASDLATARLGDSSQVAVGDSVLGVGNARGAGGTPATSRGTVASLDQSLVATADSAAGKETLSGLIEVDATIQPGDSGGPLVDDQGRVIGVNTAGSSAGLRSSRSYAVPINQAVATLRQIESGRGSATVHVGPSAFLGVLVKVASSGGGGSAAPSTGLPVGNVVGGAAAARAGLGPGDVITSLDGRSVRSVTDLRAIMLGHHPRDVVKLAWTDVSGHSHGSSVELGTGPPT